MMSHHGDGSGWLLLLGPGGGAGFYWAMFQYYRNTNKSFAFERETAVVAKPVTGSEQKIDEVRDTRESKIDGNNVSAYRQRVQRVDADSA